MLHNIFLNISTVFLDEKDWFQRVIFLAVSITIDFPR
jgi:hypothetical protein